MANTPSPEPRDAAPRPTDAAAPIDDSQLPWSAWLARNGLFLLTALALCGWLYYKFGAEGFGNILKVAVGLGFVIFIHELGHFAVAKWCDVHVETFSIGFGPALPGCRFQRGETEYKIALIPLGGYVKMVGEGSEEEGDEDNPRSFSNKTVGQRMAIISAGVIMNLILGAACFAIAYQHGVKQTVGAFGAVEPGSPAWRKGIRTGTQIRRIGDIDNPSFEDLKYVVMLSRAGQVIPFTVVGPDGKEQTVDLEPRRDAHDSAPVIGVLPQWELRLLAAKDGKPYDFKPVQGAAVEARAVDAVGRPLPEQGGFDYGDAVVGTTDPDQPAGQYDPLRVKELPRLGEPRQGEMVYDTYEFFRRMRQLVGKPVIIQVRRDGAAADAAPTALLVPPAHHRTMGARMRIGKVAALRDESPAREKGVREHDHIRAVEATDAQGRKVRFVLQPGKPTADVVERPLDPLRLGHDLRELAAGRPDFRVTLTVARENEKNHKADDLVTITDLPWDDRFQLSHEIATGMRSPTSVPELGLAYQVETTIEDVAPDSPAAKAGLRGGDTILEVRFKKPVKGGAPTWDRWLELWTEEKAEGGGTRKKPEPSWPRVFAIIQELDKEEVQLKVQRGSEELSEPLELSLAVDSTWPSGDRGLRLETAWRLQRADGIGHALWLGFQRTHRSVMQVYLSLHSMVTNRVSVTKNLTGPIGIAATAYAFAGEDLNRFILFLGIISINLAVVNFLPIPVLDGGHMVFLVYEKLRGRRPSEGVRVGATYVGLALILSLMVFVIGLDVKRWFLD